MSKKSIPLSPKTVEIIKTHLAARHITHEEFAKQLKITPRTLNNWLSGRTAIEFNKLDHLVKTLGVGLEELFGHDIPQDYVFHQEAAQGKTGFVPVKARWVIERSNASMERCKSLVKNFERTLLNANAKINLCFVRLLFKRLASLL